MKQYLCVLVGVISFLAATTYGQSSSVDSINSISLTGGSSDSVGRINAKVILVNSGVDHTTVCDAVGWKTAIFICQQLGYMLPIKFGTASTFEGIESGQTPALIRGLTCEGVSYSECQFQQAVVRSCSDGEQAAISCILTPGEVAGIAIGVVLGCLLLICLPIIICCCCCCGLCACLTGRSRREPPYSQMPGTYQQKVEVQVNS